MQLATLAFGRTGGKILNEIRSRERLTMLHINEIAVAIDTDQGDVGNVTKIDEENQIFLTAPQLDGNGTRANLKQALTVIENSTHVFQHYADTAVSNDVDAFLVIGNLGGGTGAAGTSVCAKYLAMNTDLPVYGVAVLPSTFDPGVLAANAVLTIQSFEKYTDNLIVFDNHAMNVAYPEHHPELPDDASFDDAFDAVNARIGDALHVLFAADERSEPRHLQGSTLDTTLLQNALNTNGISSLNVASETLPRPAQPGVLARVSEVYAHLRGRAGRFTSGANGTRDVDTDRSSSDENGVVGERDAVREAVQDSCVFTRVDALQLGFARGRDPAMIDEENTIRTSTGTPLIDLDKAPPPVRSPQPSDTLRNSGASTGVPHPTRLAPLALHPEAASIRANPKTASHVLFLLVAAKSHLARRNPVDTIEWARDVLRVNALSAGNFPVKKKRVSMVVLCSGVSITDRVLKLERYAVKSAEEYHAGKGRGRSGDSTSVSSGRSTGSSLEDVLGTDPVIK